jgi:hypothetical protein
MEACIFDDEVVFLKEAIFFLKIDRIINLSKI